MTPSKPSREWWAGPASVSGDHHPPGQTNLTHALSVWRCARWAWRRVPWAYLRHSPRHRRAFLLAALYHDIGKSIDRANHETAGASWALRRWPDLPMVAYLIVAHSGRWGPTWCDRQKWMLNHETAVPWQRVIDLDNEQHRWLADLLAGCDYVDAHRHEIWKPSAEIPVGWADQMR